MLHKIPHKYDALVVHIDLATSCKVVFSWFTCYTDLHALHTVLYIQTKLLISFANLECELNVFLVRGRGGGGENSTRDTFEEDLKQ